MTAKKSTKTGKKFREGGGIVFWLARIYTPVFLISKASRTWFLMYKIFFDSQPACLKIENFLRICHKHCYL